MILTEAPAIALPEESRTVPVMDTEFCGFCAKAVPAMARAITNMQNKTFNNLTADSPPEWDETQRSQLQDPRYSAMSYLLKSHYRQETAACSQHFSTGVAGYTLFSTGPGKIFQAVFFATRGNSRTFHCGVILP